MFLSDRNIEKKLKDGQIVIDPIENLEAQLQPASFDLYLDNEILVPNQEALRKARSEPEMPSIRDGDKDWRWKEDEIEFAGEGYRLEPGEFILGATREHVELAGDIVGKLDGRSSIARMGVAAHAAAGFGDPGFEGQFTLEIINHSHTDVYLHQGRRVIQAYFFQLEDHPRQTYADKDGKYMDSEGPVSSQIAQDWEND